MDNRNGAWFLSVLELDFRSGRSIGTCKPLEFRQRINIVDSAIAEFLEFASTAGFIACCENNRADIHFDVLIFLSEVNRAEWAFRYTCIARVVDEMFGNIPNEDSRRGDSSREECVNRLS